MENKKFYRATIRISHLEYNTTFYARDRDVAFEILSEALYNVKYELVELVEIRE